MKLISYFSDFLENEVNLDNARLDRLDGSIEAITNFLEGSSLAGGFIDVIPQGSYAHKTIIKPVQENDEFDADLLLHLEESSEWEASDYVDELCRYFRGNGIYKEKVQRRTRCVTIDYAGDFHIDVVPYLERHDKKYITNRRDNVYELTDPEAYNAWLDDKNRTASRNLVKTIRLVKYLRDYKRTFDVKSVILNVLLGEQVNDAALLADPGCYADVPTALRTVMNRLCSYVEDRPYLPSIMDPSGTQENFGDRWNQDGYAAFRTAVIRYAEWIDDAWSDTDRDSSLKKWQRAFGEEFQQAKKPESAKSLVRSESALPASYHNTEQTLSDLGIGTSIVPVYRFRITGKVLRKGSMGAYHLKDRGNKVLKGRSIQFSVVECNVPTPHEVYWKVMNRGPEALGQDCIRGQIEEGTRLWRREEPTSFRGPHFVECYLVKDGVCVAKDRQEVMII